MRVQQLTASGGRIPNLPDQISGKAPAILCPHGHWSRGAADPVVQSRCIGLARNGCVVLIVDTVHGSDTLAGMVDIGVMTWNNMGGVDWVQNQQIMGRWEMGMGARDLHAAVQYLRDRPGIDARRISCLARGETGLAGMVLAALSGGLLALALDDVGMTYRSGRQEPAVFNLLSCGDLPEIMSAARVPNLYINAAVAEPYEIVRRIRALLGVTGQVELHSTAAFLACEQGLGWIVREGRDDGSWQVAPCSQSPRVVLRCRP